MALKIKKKCVFGLILKVDKYLRLKILPLHLADIVYRHLYFTLKEIVLRVVKLLMYLLNSLCGFIAL